MTAKTLVVGIGSPHGDDQAGWRVIENLQVFPELAADLRIASVPHDLLDWLAGRDDVHIVDGLAGASGLLAGVCWRFRLERDALGLIRFRNECGDEFLEAKEKTASSHGIDLLETLELANALGILPASVQLWAIPGFDFRPEAELSLDCDRISLQASAMLRRELGTV